MKNPELAELNFKKLLHYSSLPDVLASDSAPTPCTGFCVACEKNGVFDNPEDQDKRLDQMSHGADTDDFEKAICPLPAGGIEFPVAFLLESPGGYYENGTSIEYERITKQPPINRYYWLPQGLLSWPVKVDEVEEFSYGPYFAYLIFKFQFKNAYFTNMVKCSLAERYNDQFVRFYIAEGDWHRDTKIRTNCFNLFLSEEMRILNPKVVFYFGQKAEKMGFFSGLNSRLKCARLYHPSRRNGYRFSWEQLIAHNDEIIQCELDTVL